MARSITSTGLLEYEQIEKKTHLTYAYAKYPLKFLHPVALVRKDADLFVTCLLGYGGGIVSGDVISIQCLIEKFASVVICTQATTKIFRSQSSNLASQQLIVDLKEYSTLAYLPDPVTCFRHSRYRQEQFFNLHHTSNLLAVDWVTSGRQRGYINHRFDCIRRVETHENWDFEEYYSVNEIKIDERMVFKDRIRLTDEEDDPIHARMKGYHVYGLIILVGKRFDPIKELILHSSLRKNLTNESDLVPQGRFILDNSEEVVASVSQIEKNGVVVRFCAYSSHSALTYVRSILAPLDVILGFKPYSENR